MSIRSGTTHGLPFQPGNATEFILQALKYPDSSEIRAIAVDYIDQPWSDSDQSNCTKVRALLNRMQYNNQLIDIGRPDLSGMAKHYWPYHIDIKQLIHSAE